RSPVSVRPSENGRAVKIAIAALADAFDRPGAIRSAELIQNRQRAFRGDSEYRAVAALRDAVDESRAAVWSRAVQIAVGALDQSAVRSGTVGADERNQDGEHVVGRQPIHHAA